MACAACPNKNPRRWLFVDISEEIYSDVRLYDALSYAEQELDIFMDTKVPPPHPEHLKQLQRTLTWTLHRFDQLRKGPSKAFEKEIRKINNATSAGEQPERHKLLEEVQDKAEAAEDEAVQQRTEETEVRTSQPENSTSKDTSTQASPWDDDRYPLDRRARPEVRKQELLWCIDGLRQKRIEHRHSFELYKHRWGITEEEEKEVRKSLDDPLPIFPNYQALPPLSNPNSSDDDSTDEESPTQKAPWTVKELFMVMIDGYRQFRYKLYGDFLDLQNRITFSDDEVELIMMNLCDPARIHTEPNDPDLIDMSSDSERNIDLDDDLEEEDVETLAARLSEDIQQEAVEHLGGRLNRLGLNS